MALHRTILYGYRMENGTFVIDSDERAIVIEIFDSYIRGDSYKAIADTLTARKIPYFDNSFTWNKNKVARILQCEDYLGEEKYPTLLFKETFMAAQGSMKPYTLTIVPEIKELKPLLSCGICGASLERKIAKNGNERWICTHDCLHVSSKFSDRKLLEELEKEWHKAKAIPKTPKTNKTSPEILQLENKLKENDPEMEQVQRKAIIFALATKRYQLCESPSEVELPRKSWTSYVDRIHISQDKILSITWKNQKTHRKEG